MPVILFISLFFAHAPAFDNTGVAYHQPLDAIVPSFEPALPVYVYGFTTEEHYSSFIREHKIKEISTNVFGDEVWQFDSIGHIQSYTIYDDKRGGKFNYRSEYKYDREGFLVLKRTYEYVPPFSKEDYGYIEYVETDFSYSDKHRTCKYKRETVIRSNGLFARLTRKYDGRWRVQGTWTFDDAQQPVSYSGDFVDHKANVLYKYDGRGRLVEREVEFTDTKGGFKDVIEYNEEGDETQVLHYFILHHEKVEPLKQLLESKTYDSQHRFIRGSFGKDFPWPGHDLDSAAGVSYNAEYSGNLLTEEKEMNKSGSVTILTDHSYNSDAGGSIETAITIAIDSAGKNDTIRVLKTTRNKEGLIVRLDVENRHYYFKGTWYTPEFYETEEKRAVVFSYVKW